MRALAPLLVAFALACGPEATVAVAHTPAPVVDPRLVLRDAVSNILELQSAAFTLEHEEGTTALIPGFLEMRKVSGVVDIPDRFKLRVEAESSFPRAFVEIKLVVIEDQAYMTDPGTGRWGRVPAASLPFSFADLGRSLAEIIEALDSPVLVGVERLKGRETYRIRGQVESQELSSLVPGAGTGFDVGMELWLDRAEGLLLQARITGKVVPSDIPGAVRLLTLDEINVPVDIAPPE